MIVCHCNRIDHGEIEAAANDLTKADPWRVLTPGLVYKALGKRPRCGCCLALAANIIHTRKMGDLSCCKRCPMASLANADGPICEATGIELGVTAEAAE
jgi:bacterioferritin-associated ferredoxin